MMTTSGVTSDDKIDTMKAGGVNGFRLDIVLPLTNALPKVASHVSNA